MRLGGGHGCPVRSYNPRRVRRGSQRSAPPGQGGRARRSPRSPRGARRAARSRRASSARPGSARRRCGSPPSRRRRSADIWCSPADRPKRKRRFSFVGLADLIGGVVPDVLPQLPRPQRRALEAALALSESEGPPAEEGVVAFAFLSTLRKLAVGNRLLLAIDDVQWLDAPSLAMLRFALPRLETEPVAAILTARDEVPLWLRAGRAGGAAPDASSSARSASARSTSCCERASALRLPRPTLLRIWETSAGNPFFALELASALQRRGGRVGPGRGAAASLESGRARSRARRSPRGSGGSRWRGSLPRSPTRRCASSRRPPAAGQRPDWPTRSRPESSRSTGSGSASRIPCSARRSGRAPHRRNGGRSTRGSPRSLRARRNERGISRSPPPSRAARSPPWSRRRQRACTHEEQPLPPPSWPSWQSGSRLPMMSTTCAGASSTAPIRLREAGDGGRAIALLEQALEAAPPGLARAAVLVHLADAVADLDDRAKRSTSIARRSPRLRATRPSRPRFTSTSPAS